MRFIKPTPDEVTRYAHKIGFILDGNVFCDFYESKGWMVGKSPMKVWMAAVRTWKAKEPRQDRWGAPRPNQAPPDADKAAAAKSKMEALREKEWNKRELVRLAQERDDKRSQKMMEAAGDKETEIEWNSSSTLSTMPFKVKNWPAAGEKEDDPIEVGRQLVSNMIERGKIIIKKDNWIQEWERRGSDEE